MKLKVELNLMMNPCPFEIIRMIIGQKRVVDGEYAEGYFSDIEQIASQNKGKFCFY